MSSTGSASPVSKAASVMESDKVSRQGAGRARCFFTLFSVLEGNRSSSEAHRALWWSMWRMNLVIKVTFNAASDEGLGPASICNGRGFDRSSAFLICTSGEVDVIFVQREEAFSSTSRQRPSLEASFSRMRLCSSDEVTSSRHSSKM